MARAALGRLYLALPRLTGLQAVTKEQQEEPGPQEHPTPPLLPSTPVRDQGAGVIRALHQPGNSSHS